MAERQFQLGKAELEVLKVLWDEGPRTVREVLNCLEQRGRSLAYTTVQTLLTRLEQKRFVRSDKSDLAHVFRARVSRDQVTRSRLRSLVDQLFDGAVGPLVLQLVRNEALTSDEMGELQKLVEQLDRPEGGSDDGPGREGGT